MNANRLRSLPDDVCDGCLSLQSLALDYNDLEALPKHIGNLANLRLLKASYNRLADLPSSLGDLRELRGLFLLGNPRVKRLPTVAARVCWIDDDVAAPQLARGATVVRGVCDRDLPFANFVVKRGRSHCVLSLAISGLGEWGMVLDSSSLDVHVGVSADPRGARGAVRSLDSGLRSRPT